MKISIRELAVLAGLTAMLFIVQIALAFLPNIELVSLLVMIYALIYGRKALYIIYTFALLEGLLYGFSMWWISYLYVWTVLAALAWAFRRMESPLGWAILSGTFGLLFGALCELPFLFTIGWKASLAAWVSGIPFDLAHCVGNFVAALVLFRPLFKLLSKLACRTSAS